MNKKLKYAWVNIIFFVALIFLGYAVYSGTCYKTQNELESLGAAAVCMAAILLTFYGAQLVKGADHHFERNIKIEAVLLALCLPAFALSMKPFFSFWNVHDRADEVVSAFQASVADSKQIFDKYEAYADSRLDDMRVSKKCKNQLARDNKLALLEVQLRPEPYLQLKKEASAWIDANSQANVTVWNVFLVSNARSIKRAVEDWHSQLTELSSTHFDGEGPIGDFDPDGRVLQQATAGFDRLAGIYAAPASALSPMGMACAAALLFMFFVPYIAQTRNTKSHVTLTHWKQERQRGPLRDPYAKSTEKKDNKKKPDAQQPADIPDAGGIGKI